jgi:hypothetical protein
VCIKINEYIKQRSDYFQPRIVIYFCVGIHFYVDARFFNFKFSFSVSESLISLSMHCFIYLTNRSRGHRCMVIGLTTVFVITAYHY